MSEIGEREARTQKRVVEFFLNELGYRYLGHWKDREDNRQLEKDTLMEWLKGRGHSDKIINRVFRQLDQAMALGGSKNLYDANREVYRLLRYGVKVRPEAGEQHVTVWLVDWEDVTKNDFAVAEEVTVAGPHTKRPDVVLYVNGLALGVLELKRSSVSVSEGIRQNLDSQKRDFIRPFFSTVQLVMAGNDTEGLRYGVIETREKYYLTWKEEGPIDNPLDRALGQFCSKERLLEIVHDFMVFDGGVKKVCRHNQYFGVRKAQEHVRRREGGIIWHTQGSGKSLTMVMLAKALTLEPGIDDYKIILVTDRVDLDDQIYKTFRHCGTLPIQARTGKHLAQLLRENKARIITTVIDKFELAVSKAGVRDENPDIFVLVDESHRGQYGELHAKMKKVLPNACFIGFTGTPVLKKDKNTLERFGGLIDTYTIEQAVKDKAVVPLLYEGRHVDQKVDRESVDAWFDRVTEPLSKEQRADLKKKFASSDQLNKAQQKVMRIAWDVSEHFRDNWQGTPYKAQLVAQDKKTALLYHRFLEDFGLVSSEVLISGPDEREGEEDVHEESRDAIKTFWKKMMAKYGGEKEYNRQVISAFKNAESPEIIIVVDKLLTGFDAPRNTVLYLTRQLKGHTLLQAIARVNRLYDGKDFGYIIDYRGVLQNLDEALDIYGRLSEFDQEGLDDLCTALTDVDTEIQKLPQRHSDLWDLFKTIRNKGDEEAYEQLLADEARRERFYERLSAFSRTLAIALSSAAFLERTPEAKVAKYKTDLGFFMRLRISIRKRYAEAVDFKEYEARIQKLIDRHVGTGEVEKVTDLVNIFDTDAFAREVEKLGSAASKADTIAYRTKRTIHDRMQEDPAFYRRFSDMLEEAIRAFRQQRLSDAEYLHKVTEIAEKIRNRTGDDIPEELMHHDVAKAFFGVLQEVFVTYEDDRFDARPASTSASLAIDDIIQQHRIVNWVRNSDIQNRMMGAIEDYLFELKDKQGIDLTFEDIDRILEMVVDIAKHRYA